MDIFMDILIQFSEMYRQSHTRSKFYPGSASLEVGVCMAAPQWHWSSSPRGSFLRTMNNSTAVVVSQLGFVSSVTLCLLELVSS